MKMIFNSIQRDLIGGWNQFSANITEIPDHNITETQLTGLERHFKGSWNVFIVRTNRSSTV